VFLVEANAQVTYSRVDLHDLHYWFQNGITWACLGCSLVAVVRRVGGQHCSVVLYSLGCSSLGKGFSSWLLRRFV